MEIRTFGSRVRIHIDIGVEAGTEIGNFRIIGRIAGPHKEICHGNTQLKCFNQTAARCIERIV
jgi:hypothetical protein